MKALTYEQRLTAIFETERKAKAAAARKLDTAKEECKHMEDQAQAEAVLHSAEQAHDCTSRRHPPARHVRRA